jgi:hypothetical protein
LFNFDLEFPKFFYVAFSQNIDLCVTKKYEVPVDKLTLVAIIIEAALVIYLLIFE